MLSTILHPDSIYEAIPSQLPLLPERCKRSSLLAVSCPIYC